MPISRRVSPPPQSQLAASVASAHLADAFAITLADHAPSDAMTLARAALSDPPRWFRVLLGLRDALVRPFGLKTTAAMRDHLARSGVAHVDIFRVLSSTPDEVVFGEQDRHLDFKLSILVRPIDGGGREAVATTVVHCHNALGKVYLGLILPGHVVVVRSHLAAAAKRYGVTA
ncbi:DUF2867 domain-containing protein [Roseateles amylovorans]|uniref:DUF2867 domain-containing protein n=1 Tax=Roseateles amylovorans TaxID=2978473 RepID=A0ABY6AU33_9BURK|nr:DUF2867 domain-containing protein [Roseateles amylovorans]UXH76527.1 DUF2867 domain-containing protein [Roseateles amylovorans]